jgi:RimJ/RimL family protein N-acetyltransferase
MTLPAVPPLTTERLLLSGHTHADLDDARALWSDPDVVRFIGGKPATEEEVWTRLLRYVGHWAVMGFGYWVVRERQGGRFLGEVGFADFHRALTPPLEGAPEMGWVLAPHAHGRGYASEAVGAALGWARGHFGQGKRSVCLIHPDNAPSFRVAEKAGFREELRTTYKGEPTVLLARPL